jgi:hypothetical protein
MPPVEVGSRIGAPTVGGGFPVPRFRLWVRLQFHHSHVSSPRHVKRSVRISRTALSCSLHAEGYETSRAGSAFSRDRWTR